MKEWKGMSKGGRLEIPEEGRSFERRGSQVIGNTEKTRAKRKYDK